MEHYLTKSNRTQVICRLGLMLLPDVGQAMSEIYRVLKPGGRAAAIVFTTPDKNPWMSIPAMIALKHALSTGVHLVKIVTNVHIVRSCFASR